MRVRVTFTLRGTIILALIAETMMNKGLEVIYESMRVKPKKLFMGRAYQQKGTNIT